MLLPKWGITFVKDITKGTFNNNHRWNMIWLHLTSTPIPVVNVYCGMWWLWGLALDEYHAYMPTKVCPYFCEDSKAVWCKQSTSRVSNCCNCVELYISFILSLLDLSWRGGCRQHEGYEQEGGEGGAHAVLYWPVLEVDWQATPCRAPPCSPSLCGVVWSTPMRRRLLWPASEHMATGWEDEGRWCTGSNSATPGSSAALTTPHPNTLPPYMTRVSQYHVSHLTPSFVDYYRGEDYSVDGILTGVKNDVIPAAAGVSMNWHNVNIDRT